MLASVPISYMSCRLRLVHIGTLLRDQQNLLVVRHRGIQRLDRFFPAHEERDDHVRIYDDIAERKHRDGTWLLV